MIKSETHDQLRNEAIFPETKSTFFFYDSLQSSD